MKPAKKVSYRCSKCKTEFANVQVSGPGGRTLTVGKEIKGCLICDGGLVRHVEKERMSDLQLRLSCSRVSKLKG